MNHRSPRMTHSSKPSPPSAEDNFATWLGLWGAILAITLAGFIAWLPGFRVPFYLDDGPSIAANASIRQLWPLTTVLNPPGEYGETVTGRPVLNLSLALTYALGGTEVRAYHAVNLLIHLLAALTLFGLIRRTLLLPALANRDCGRVATWLGAIAALLWLLHPLQTESVTYVIQRAESLTGLFYLFTLYAYLRGATAADRRRRRGWHLAAMVSCLFGMGTKEVMVTAPLVVWLYDRTFLAGGFMAAWRERRGALIGLGATWLLLLYLVMGTAGRGTSAGIDSLSSVWHYALTQCQAVVHYLRLVVWPHPLVLDYGNGVVTSLGAVLPQALLLLGLLGAALWALVRRPTAGFFGVVFFIILAPSSSIVPVNSQTMAEHRMYLSLAAVLVPATFLAYRYLGKNGLWGLLAIALGLGAATWHRNEQLQHPELIWRQALAARPDNARAHLCLGTVLNKRGDIPDAIREYQAALAIKPDYIEALNNLGIALQQQFKFPEAIACYERLLRLRPDWPSAHYNLALALQHSGRPVEALDHYEAALKGLPDNADIHFNYANLLAVLGRVHTAIIQYQKALALRPDYPEAQKNLQFVRRAAGLAPAASAP